MVNLLDIIMLHNSDNSPLISVDVFVAPIFIRIQWLISVFVKTVLLPRWCAIAGLCLRVNVYAETLIGQANIINRRPINQTMLTTSWDCCVIILSLSCGCGWGGVVLLFFAFVSVKTFTFRWLECLKSRITDKTGKDGHLQTHLSPVCANSCLFVDLLFSETISRGGDHKKNTHFPGLYAFIWYSNRKTVRHSSTSLSTWEEGIHNFVVKMFHHC